VVVADIAKPYVDVLELRNLTSFFCSNAYVKLPFINQNVLFEQGHNWPQKPVLNELEAMFSPV